jgi:hypothetical protein
LDVGRLSASLRVPALRTSGNPSSLVEAQEAFLDEYLTLGHGNEKRIRLFEAVSLMISAATPFRLQRIGWEEQTEIMLDESEKTLQKANGGFLSTPTNIATNQS